MGEMKIFCVFCLLVVFSFQSCPNPRIPEVFQCTGSHYECFKKMASHFKPAMTTVFSDSEMKSLLTWKTNNPKTYAAFDSLIKSSYPHYYDELRGIADGSEVDFERVLLLNLENEIERGPCKDDQKDERPNVKTSQLYYDRQCTDIHVNIENRRCIGHNEDGGVIYHNITFMVDFDLKDGDGNEPPRFKAFVYPGILPGLAFGWNDVGFTFSMNALFTKTCRVGIPKSIVNRDALSSVSWDDLIDKTVGVENRAAGHSMNVGNINDNKQLLIELATYTSGVRNIIGNYSHMNNYRLLAIDFVNDESSVYRLARANQFSDPKDPNDIRQILGDTTGFEGKFPIYNSGTMASCLYDIDAKTASIYCCENPKTTKPNLVLDLTW